MIMTKTVLSSAFIKVHLKSKAAETLLGSFKPYLEENSKPIFVDVLQVMILGEEHLLIEYKRKEI